VKYGFSVRLKGWLWEQCHRYTPYKKTNEKPKGLNLAGNLSLSGFGFRWLAADGTISTPCSECAHTFMCAITKNLYDIWIPVAPSKSMSHASPCELRVRTTCGNYFWRLQSNFRVTAGPDFQTTAVRVLEQHACHLLMGNASKVTHNGLHFLYACSLQTSKASRLQQACRWQEMGALD